MARAARFLFLSPVVTDFSIILLLHQEDELLTNLIAVYGPRNWSLIANGIPGRSGKSCRLRYAKSLLKPPLQSVLDSTFCIVDGAISSIQM